MATQAMEFSMPTLSLASHTSNAADLEFSHITGLAIFDVNGEDILYATTRLDGFVSAWDISSGGMTLIDADAYAQTAIAGGTPALAMMGDALLTSGGAAGQLVVRGLDGTGAMGNAATVGNTSTFSNPLGETTTLTQADGTTFAYSQITGDNGVAVMEFTVTGTLSTTHITQNVEVAAIASVEIGTRDYVFTATNEGLAGVSAWAVQPNGSLMPASTLTTETGLWIDAPTAMDTAVVDGETYLVLGSAGSNSLTVMGVAANGTLTIQDHLMDDRNSRFGAVADIEIVTAQGHTYVIAGGGDDGISIYQILPGGQLLARGHIADTPDMGLANLSSIAATADATGITIYVGSSAEIGITELRFEIGEAGITQTVNRARGSLDGTDGMDILTGGTGANSLSGGAGDDIFFDDTGRDTLTGGAGADTFIMSYDETLDIVTDFDPNVDILDLSAWPSLRSMSQLFLIPTADGIKIVYGNETLLLCSVDGQPITPDMLNENQIISGTRLPEVHVNGFPGPVVTPDLPERPELIAPTKEEQAEGSLTLRGTDAADVLTGEGVGDIIYGMGGNDTLRGMEGADWMNGQAGSDRLYGGDDADILIGGEGRATQLGAQAANADILNGEGGNDQLFGQSGDDILNGGAGDDILEGGGGRDTFVFTEGYDVVADFSVHADQLTLETDLWSGDLTAQQVVNRYATTQGNSVVFDFGDGDVLTLADIDSTQGLADLITFI